VGGSNSHAGPKANSGEGLRLYGREAERAAIDRLLEEARRSRSGALVLRAEAGVGKSALLSYARNRGDDMRILQAIGVEPEIELPFAALYQLLEPVFPYLDQIPDVQAAALRSALGIAPGDTNRFVIALAVLSLLGEVAADGPLLCLVDDAHWLDQPSADALSFVARRLEAEGIVMLFAARVGDARSFPGLGLAEVDVRGLDPGAAELLLVERFGPAVAPATRRVIREAAQGVPLALLEIPMALTPAQLSGREALPHPMPLGHDLEAILLERVRRLPASAQLLLLVATAEGSGEADVVLSAAGALGIPPATLLDAEGSGLIVGEGNTLVFRHPILRSAIYQAASLPQRQAAHRALVDILEGEPNADRRAWHRAALVLAPDDEVADELERTAERARSRSGHAAAHRALRRAAELTSSNERRARRLASAARAAWNAGRPDEATALLRATEAETEMDADTYAELRHIQGEIELSCGTPLHGATLLREGVDRVARSDPRKALQMLLDMAMCANFAGDLGVMSEAGRRAAALPIGESEPEAPLVDLIADVTATLQGNDPGVRARLLQTLDHLADVTEPRWLVWAGAAANRSGDQGRDEAFCRRAEAIARQTTAVGTLAQVLQRIAWRDLSYGRVAAASIHSAEGLQLALETGLTNSACFHRSILAWAAAVRGDEETCTSLAEQALATALEHGLGPQSSIAQWALGLLHLGLGRWEAAATQLEAVSSPAPGSGHSFVALWTLPDLVEAAVRAGRRDVAESAATRFAGYAPEGAPDSELALAARCRALVTRHSEAKERLLSEALILHEGDPRPFGRARTLLLLGEHLRRERRRVEARSQLRTATELFERLGATPWEERARAELRATGETARKRAPSTLTQLTPQQLHIVRLVAEGATNKEVAAQLFLSPRTVDHHLRNVFTKLGIASRAELIRLPDLDGSIRTSR
jgi:DNA-binding CsgD family transcriptional regulator